MMSINKTDRVIIIKEVVKDRSDDKKFYQDAMGKNGFYE